MSGSNQRMAGRGPWETFPVTPTYSNWWWSPDPPPIRRRQLPWLLLPELDDHQGATTRLSFVEVLTGDRHDFPLVTPITTSWRCRGSSHDWLVILDKSPNVVVLNPFTREQCSLLPPVTRFDPTNVDEEYGLSPSDPSGEVELDLEYESKFQDGCSSLTNMRDFFIKKIILSDCPTRDFTALAIFHGNENLAFYKPGQASWTLIPGIHVEDAVYFKGKVYALSPDPDRWIHTCDVNCNSPELEKMEIGGSKDLKRGALYLVSACDELFVVSRFFDPGSTDRFEVFKLSSSESGKKWERVSDLRDTVLFVGGYSCSSAHKASEFPGCNGNSIYYTDDRDYPELFEDEYDMGIFYLDKPGTFYLPCKCDKKKVACNCDKRVSRGNPIWFAPNPFSGV